MAKSLDDQIDDLSTNYGDRTRKLTDVFTDRLLHKVKEAFFKPEYAALVQQNPLVSDERLTKLEHRMRFNIEEYINRISQGVNNGYAANAREIESDRQDMYAALGQAFNMEIAQIKARGDEDASFDEFVGRYAASAKSVLEEQRREYLRALAVLEGTGLEKG